MNRVTLFLVFITLLYNTTFSDDQCITLEQEGVECHCQNRPKTLESARNYLQKRERGIYTSTKREFPSYGTDRNRAIPDSAQKISNVMVIVESELYEAITDRVERYITDVQKAYGCDIVLEIVSKKATAEDLKLLLQGQYHNDTLQGAVLIGDLPVAFFHHAKYDQTFPCDYFLMDLDGSWRKKEGEEFAIYDSSYGEWEADIFVGRISTAYLADIVSDEIEAIQEFFDKNHAYWEGITEVNRGKALTCTDRDWSSSSYFLDDIQYLYGDSLFEAYYYVYDPDDLLHKNNPYNTTEYLHKLGSDEYEFIQLACHSDELQHHFYGYDYFDTEHHVTTDHIKEIAPKAIGYNLFCCYAANWTNVRTGNLEGTEGYLAGAYLYSAGSKALTTVASTKSGGMLSFKKFYKPLGQGDAMGSAFHKWHREQKAYYDKYSSLKQSGYITWYYGLMILGDPMISFKYDPQSTAIKSIENTKADNMIDFTIDNQLLLKIPSNYKGAIEADIFDLKGRLVKSYIFEPNLNNSYTLFDKTVGNGLYLCIIKAGTTSIKRRLVLTK